MGFSSALTLSGLDLGHNCAAVLLLVRIHDWIYTNNGVLLLTPNGAREGELSQLRMSHQSLRENETDLY